jgi:hypothetical protein
MAAGRAVALSRLSGLPVLILDRNGAPRWSPHWAGNPHILDPQRASGIVHVTLCDAKGARPYVDTITAKRFRWRAGQQPARPSLYLTAGDRAARLEGDYVALAPATKRDRPNKRWPHWAALGALLPWRGVEIVPAGDRPLTGLPTAHTASFREAAGVLAAARGVIAPEGAMHHAAAALGVPAVVIYGSWIGPDITGYPGQVALTAGGRHAPCGLVAACPLCLAAMSSITPEQVLDAATAQFDDVAIRVRVGVEAGASTGDSPDHAPAGA